MADRPTIAVYGYRTRTERRGGTRRRRAQARPESRELVCSCAG
ncbi:hypothetical protein ACFH04_06735 [Streptomyces noboritoensis]|uniref:Uncharacterized protein n=1 Tax=Streptomyces noboritoensis TaxID=67337 RepID=A0ABV6TCB4_9ACTN